MLLLWQTRTCLPHAFSSLWESLKFLGAFVVLPVVSVVMEYGAQRREILHSFLVLATVRIVAASTAMWEGVPKAIDKTIRADIRADLERSARALFSTLLVPRSLWTLAPRPYT